MKDVTAIVKTFLRDKVCDACISSLRMRYPDIHILVADDGYESEEKESNMKALGVDEYVRMPFNSGLTKGRNLLISKVKTPYVLIGDDDFYYINSVSLEKMVKLLDKADIVGGSLVVDGKPVHYEAYLSYSDDGKGLIYTAMKQDEFEQYGDIRYKYCDLTFNFFVARKEVFDKVKWDENIMVAYEHSEFFLSAKEAGLKVCFTPDSVVQHRIPNIEADPEYMKYRGDRSAKTYFLKKRGLEYMVDMKGIKATLWDNK